MALQDQWTKAGLTDAQNQFSVARRRMVTDQLIPGGVTDQNVLLAMGRVPRHAFVEEGMWNQAYLDRPLPIGDGQTISQPLIVGLMTQQLELTGREKILEIGTGSGYQSAVLLEMGCQVFSIERLSKLSNRARKILYGTGYTRFTLRIGDGTLGWPEEAPFDRIIVTAGAPVVPEALIDQLADGGRLIIPVGSADAQQLTIIDKRNGMVSKQMGSACRFVKLIGQHGWTKN